MACLDCKPWLQSKTLWFNALAAAVAAAEESLHLLQPLLGEATYPVLLFAVTVVNSVLRVFTRHTLRSS